MKKLIVLASLVMTFAFASNGFAAGYGAAGCGFGGKVIDHNDILSQLGAATLNNVTPFSQASAISSGTSGCGQSGLVMAKNEQHFFVEHNYETLAKEMALGGGENITVLASLLGCEAEQARKLGSFTQTHYPSIFQTDETSPIEMLVALKKGLAEEAEFASSCRKI